MGKAFTGNEREIIYNSLLDKGKEMFAHFGLKRTSVDDIVSEVGISKGTFYQFFKSKEAFFQEIFEREVKNVRSTIASFLEDQSRDPANCIRNFIRNYIEIIENNPFVQKTTLHNGGMPGVKTMVTRQTILKRREEWVILLSSYVKRWQKKGLIIEGDPELIASIIRSVVYLLFHKTEIGAEVFPKIIEFWSNSLSSALVKAKPDTEPLSHPRKTHKSA